MVAPGATGREVMPQAIRTINAICNHFSSKNLRTVFDIPVLSPRRSSLDAGWSIRDDQAAGYLDTHDYSEQWVVTRMAAGDHAISPQTLTPVDYLAAGSAGLDRSPQLGCDHRQGHCV